MVSILLDPGPDAEPIRERVESPGESLHVPHLLNIEVLNVLRRQTLRGILAEERGATVLQDLESIRMIRYPHAPLLERIWDLRGNLTAYDAAYIALAEALDAPLVTTDTWLVQARGNRVTVELYK
jgi:predicted nucleic acid-binding protein